MGVSAHRPWFRLGPGLLCGCGAVAAGAQYLPSTVVLGQWTTARSIPGGWCRWRGPDRPAVALTFDDGPHPDGTPAVIEALDRLDLRATFFCLGSQMERHPELVLELVRHGHQVETHGFAHEHHMLRSPRWVLRDLRRAVRTATDLGCPPAWYRPTYGQVTGATLVSARRLGLRPVLWSAWGREWASSDPAEVAGRIGRRLAAGAIVLLHDGDAYGTAGMWRVGIEALRRVAGSIERRGLQASTLGEMCGDPGRGLITAVASVQGGRNRGATTQATMPAVPTADDPAGTQSPGVLPRANP